MHIHNVHTVLALHMVVVSGRVSMLIYGEIGMFVRIHALLMQDHIAQVHLPVQPVRQDTSAWAVHWQVPLLVLLELTVQQWVFQVHLVVLHAMMESLDQLAPHLKPSVPRVLLDLTVLEGHPLCVQLAGTVRR